MNGSHRMAIILAEALCATKQKTYQKEVKTARASKAINCDCSLCKDVELTEDETENRED